ncbi:GNAT family N-acetyltransferase [Rossellomorea aquimaris]|uniref:GNAT family N-acetyltransferase n=1 Tax=Rossellomorea aquimaris TaxID=189382 RepID=UPI0011E95E01|nr:GNAT family protein [Rossellomorea aquimaris]TYS91509.1 GNAT family N-acetyltransferase [Rossellomorea aquimaris]
MFTYKLNDELELRLLDIQDAERIHELTDQSRSYLREWLPWVDYSKTVEDSTEFIKATRLGFANNKSLTTGIIYQNEIVGVAGFNVLDWANKVAYIGYWLGEGYQGKGIMTTVAKGLTTYAFDYYKMNKVEITAAEFNHRSRAIPERLGFKEEGKLRQREWIYDHFVDHIVYGMLADEWKMS